MSLLLLLKPRRGAGTTPEPPPSLPATPNAGRHKPIARPRLERFRAGTARIFVRACQPSLILVPTPGVARLAFAASGANWEQRLQSEAKKEPLTYRATRDEEREFDELVETAFLLSR